MSVSEIEFKKLLSAFPTGVSVITYSHNNKNHGITISSLASLSLSPQLISFSINKQSSRYNNLLDCEYYNVNILSESQEKISKLFVNKDYTQEKSNLYLDKSKASKAPIISGCICYIECKKETIYDGGDHSIFISKVMGGELLSNEGPLLYFRGKYKKFI